MKLGFDVKLLSAIVACCAAVAAQASTVWNETDDGDFSNDGLTPTPLVMAIGTNSIFGTTGNSGPGVDRDYFSFTVPTGASLTSLDLLSSTTVSGGSSFIGLQAGPQLTVSSAGAGVENLLGFMHYSNDQIGTDLLPSLIFGFTGALPSGTYSAWVQETGGPVSYGLSFGVTPVPLPGAAALLLSGLLGLTTLRRRRGNAG